MYVGTFELGDEEQEEIYEVINIGKIKAHTPNLRVINLYGISFVDDTHVEMLSSNCIHLECLSLSFCLKVNGSSMKSLIHRCKKLKTLLLQHCSTYMHQYAWFLLRAVTLMFSNLFHFMVYSSSSSSSLSSLWLDRRLSFRHWSVPCYQRQHQAPSSSFLPWFYVTTHKH